MSEELFLIDANSLITPHLTYYPFDFAPGFWQQMQQHILSGRIVILDMVKNEILEGNDNLTEWMKSLTIGKFVDRREPSILFFYSEVLQHIQNNPCYQPAALAEWSRETVADPWLISAAKANNYTIVTLEVSNPGLNPKTPSKNAKIPDVADALGVKSTNLFYMMRELKFSL